MTDEFHNEETGIPLITVGHMRLVGLRAPDAYADSSDETLVVFSREKALAFAKPALLKWQVPSQEAEEFVADINDEVIRDMLITHQILRLAIPGQAHRFMHSPREAHGGFTPWELFKQGKSAVIRRELENQVYAGGW